MADVCDMADVAIAGGLGDELARVTSRLGGPGAAECVDCDALIPQARRRALPSARRCAPCQGRAERGFRSGASR